MVVGWKEGTDRAQDSLFDQWGYTYCVFVTNLEWDEKDICRFYDKRADVENHIKEARYDFSIDHISTQSFYANAADLELRLLAMNQIIMFAREALSLTFGVEMTIVKNGWAKLGCCSTEKRCLCRFR